VPKNHTGVDIAANMGTKIKSATSGEVVFRRRRLRKTFKNTNRRS
jgi:murein DD-endopeptidase MepM/ murein hydrolase activator NlpD